VDNRASIFAPIHHGSVSISLVLLQKHTKEQMKSIVPEVLLLRGNIPVYG